MENVQNSIQSAQIRRHWIKRKWKKDVYSSAIWRRWVHAARMNADVFGGNDHLRAFNAQDDCSGYCLLFSHSVFLPRSPHLLLSASLHTSSGYGQCARNASIYQFSSVIWLNFWLSIIPLICFVFVFTKDTILRLYLDVERSSKYIKFNGKYILAIGIEWMPYVAWLSLKFLRYFSFVSRVGRRGIVYLVKLCLLWIFAIILLSVRAWTYESIYSVGEIWWTKWIWMDQRTRMIYFPLVKYSYLPSMLIRVKN